MPIKSINKSTNKQTTNKNSKSTSRRSAFLLGKKTKVNPFNESIEQGNRTCMKTFTSKKEATRVSVPNYSYENKKHLAEQRDLCNSPVDVEVPLMTQDELVRAKKKCFSTARRLHKIKRRLLLDIAEESEKAEAAENTCPQTSSKTRARRRSRRTRTGSFMPHHQNSDSTMSTFFESSSSIRTAAAAAANDDDDDDDSRD